MTAALEVGEWSAARPGRTLPPGKTQYPFYRGLGRPQARSGRAKNLVPTVIFFNRHSFIQVHCLHSSTYVTATFSILPAVRVSYHNRYHHFHTSPCLSIHLSLVHYTRTPRIHFPAPSLHTYAMSEGVHPVCRGLYTPFLGRRYAGNRGCGESFLFGRGIISYPLQSPVPLPNLHHSPLSLPLKPGPRYQECATFDIHLNQTPTTFLFSPLQC